MQHKNISNYLEQSDWNGLKTFLERLSHGDFRKAESYVRNSALSDMDNNHFWAAFRFFVLFRPQAFLPCIVNIRHLAKDQTLHYDTPDVKAIAEGLSEENLRKLANIAIPHLQTEQQISGLFEALHLTNSSTIISILLRESTPLCYYMLLKTLKQHGEEKELCLRAYRALVKRNDDQSFNMASILRTYFGLEEAPGCLSLHIEHYELSYLESSFDNFKYVLQGRRPKID